MGGLSNRKNCVGRLNKAEFFGREYFESGTVSNYVGYQYNESFDALARALCERFAPKIHLDVGCAKGFLVHAMRKLGVDSWGVDISQYALESAPSDVKGTTLQTDVDYGLPFMSEVFDFVTCLTTIEHLTRPELFLEETRRVLKDGGRLYLVTDDPENPKAVHIIQKDISHVNVKNYQYWHRMLSQHDFLVRRAGLWPCPPSIIAQGGCLGAVIVSMLGMVRPAIWQRLCSPLLTFDQIAHKSLLMEMAATKEKRP